MNRVRQLIHLEEVREYTRNPIAFSIAVLDSGIGRHPDLEGKCIAFQDFVGQKTRPYDDYGHGTHVCGILCGSGEVSKGKYRGIFPSGRLVVGKVLDDKGKGTIHHMLHALEWIEKNRKKYGIRVLNISVGFDSLQDEILKKELTKHLELLWDEGVIVVCSAGNKGPAEGSISSLGNTDKIIVVGCCDEDMERKKSCEKYSGRGLHHSLYRKPDIVAPGTNIISCSHRIQWGKDGYHDPYMALSGTSMATPVVTGCLSLLIQKEPYLTNAQIRERLHYTARDLHKPWNFQGWGMIHAKSFLENQ